MHSWALEAKVAATVEAAVAAKVAATVEAAAAVEAVRRACLR